MNRSGETVPRLGFGYRRSTSAATAKLSTARGRPLRKPPPPGKVTQLWAYLQYIHKMRSLTLWKSDHISLPQAEFSSSGELVGFTSLAVDLDQNALFLTSEGRDALNDSEAHVRVWRLSQGEDATSPVSASLVCAAGLTRFNWFLGGVV